MRLPHTSYVICTTPRSGSHLLADALQITGVAGKPDEYFIVNKEGKLQNEQGNIAELYGKRTLEEFHQLVLSFGSTANGVFGIIIQWDYLQYIFDNFRTLPQYKALSDKVLLDALFSHPKFIWLQRRDKVLQAISWIKAHQTGVWGVPKGEPTQDQARKALAYDFYLIDQNVDRFVNAEKAWGAFFKTNEIDPLVVVYEDLAQSFEQTSRSLHAFLDIPYPEAINFKNRKWQKQAGRLNEAWANKFVWQKKSFPHRVFRYLSYLRLKYLPF